MSRDTIAEQTTRYSYNTKENQKQKKLNYANYVCVWYVYIIFHLQVTENNPKQNGKKKNMRLIGIVKTKACISLVLDVNVAKNWKCSWSIYFL